MNGCAQLLSVQHCSCPFAISILWCWQNHCTSQLLPLVATGQLTGQLTGLAFGRAFAQVPVWSICPLVVTKLCYSGSFAFCFGSSAAGRQISMTTCLFLWPPVEPFMAAVRLYYSSTPSWCCAVCAELTLLAARALEPACAWTASGRLHSSLVTRGSKALMAGHTQQSGGASIQACKQLHVTRCSCAWPSAVGSAALAACAPLKLARQLDTLHSAHNDAKHGRTLARCWVAKFKSPLFTMPHCARSLAAHAEHAAGSLRAASQ